MQKSYNFQRDSTSCGEVNLFTNKHFLFMAAVGRTERMKVTGLHRTKPAQRSAIESSVSRLDNKLHMAIESARLPTTQMYNHR